jgi:phage I-like protein
VLHRRSNVVRLTVAVPGDEPPTAFRIFAAGPNESTKGTFLFDESAAAQVMAEYQAHGIDLMIDYDHFSLAAAVVDPAHSGKAAGWFNLEVRDGELWAVNVRWTPPAAESLKRKEWRFMSPAFSVDSSDRITAVTNVAITNLPATRRLQPLMAASMEKLSMNRDLITEALDALVAEDADKCSEILKGLIADAASGEPAPAPEPLAEEPAAELAAPDAAALPVDEDEEKATLVATSSSLTKLTDKTEPLEQLAVIHAWRTSHLELEAEKAKVAKERRSLELSQYKAYAAELVKLGAETPHTSGLAGGKVCARLLAEPLADQSARIVALRAGRTVVPAIRPPAGDVVDGLSASDLAKCKASGLDPAALSKTKASIKRVSGATKGV